MGISLQRVGNFKLTWLISDKVRIGKQGFLILDSVFLPEFYPEYCLVQYLSELPSIGISCNCCLKVFFQGKHCFHFLLRQGLSKDTSLPSSHYSV